MDPEKEKRKILNFPSPQSSKKQEHSNYYTSLSFSVVLVRRTASKKQGD